MYEQFPEVMNMLWARMLRDNKKNWRRVYKVCHRIVKLSHKCILNCVTGLKDQSFLVQFWLGLKQDWTSVLLEEQSIDSIKHIWL